jgi:hypothetical protein
MTMKEMIRWSQNDAGPKVVQKVRRETGDEVADQAAADDFTSPVRNRLGEIEIQESCKGEKKAQGSGDALDRGRKWEAAEGKNRQGGKDRYQPKGGKPEGTKNPS